MHLNNTVHAIFKQLADLLAQLNNDEYSASLTLLSGHSLGKHVRHVLEFFDVLVNAVAAGDIVNYDKRSHDTLIENHRTVAAAKIASLIEKIDGIDGGKELFLEAAYASGDGKNILAKTSFDRELAYNIEHAIHHMAIIKIAVSTLFPNVRLSYDFGVAYSTLKYQKEG